VRAAGVLAKGRMFDMPALGDQGTRYDIDTCYCGQEIPAFELSRWYGGKQVDVTFTLPTPPIPVSGRVTYIYLKKSLRLRARVGNFCIM